MLVAARKSRRAPPMSPTARRRIRITRLSRTRFPERYGQALQNLLDDVRSCARGASGVPSAQQAMSQDGGGQYLNVIGENVFSAEHGGRSEEHTSELQS